MNWNGAALLRRYLPSVIEGTNADIADVVVVDNGSTDESRQVLETEFPEVRTLYFDTNYGYAEGYNRAIAQLGYEYSLLLNSDVAVPAGWLEPLYDFMLRNPDVAACQPKFSPKPASPISSMPERRAVLSTSTVIPIAAAAFSARWRPTMASMTTLSTFSGLRERRCSCVRTFI